MADYCNCGHPEDQHFANMPAEEDPFDTGGFDEPYCIGCIKAYSYYGAVRFHEAARLNKTQTLRPENYGQHIVRAVPEGEPTKEGEG